MAKRWQRVRAAAAWALAALVALSAGKVRAERPRPELVIVVGQMPKTLDPALATGTTEMMALGGLFEGLTRRDAASGVAVPGQAESWETSPDGRRWVFHLRAGARWTNGDTVTAHDFVRGWLHVLAPGTYAEYAYLLHVVRHARAYNTHAAALERLRGPDREGGPLGLLARLRAARAANPAGVSVGSEAWRGVVAELRVPEVLSALRDPETLALLLRAHRGVSAAEADALGEGLASEAVRLNDELTRARLHLGKDEGVYASDDRTLVVELEAFAPWFLTTTALPLAFPRRPLLDEDSERKGRDYLPIWAVSNGPYLVSAWEPERRLRLRRNPAYWGVSDVRLQTLELLGEEDDARQVELFRAGKADWLPFVSESTAGGAGTGLTGTYGGPQLTTYFLRVNCSRPPFSDPRVRRALALAIDRRALVATTARVAFGTLEYVVPPGVPGYEPPGSLVRHDPPEARRLLAEAGFPGGQGFPVVEYLHNVHEGHARIGEHLAKMLAMHLGIRVRLVTAPWQEFVDRTIRLDYDLSRAGWILDYPDPQNALDMWRSGSAENRTGWGDARFDRVLAHAAHVFGFLEAHETEQEEVVRAAHDPKRLLKAIDALRRAKPAERMRAAEALRMDLLREAEAILVQEAFPILPLFQYGNRGAISPRVEGFHTVWTRPDGQKVPNVEGIHPLRDLGLRK
jgi:oligopeptide transport system substrate-binding protein